MSLSSTDYYYDERNLHARAGGTAGAESSEFQAGMTLDLLPGRC